MTPQDDEKLIHAAGEGGFERAQSGLLVPEGTIELKREAWTNEDIKVLKRFYRFAHTHGENVLLQCRKCGELVGFVQTDKGVEMPCKCTKRVLI